MNAANKIANLVDELAAHWTEPTLEMLKEAGLQEITVDTELVTWHILKKVIHEQIADSPSFQVATLVSMRTLMARTISTAAVLIAEDSDPVVRSYAFETRVFRSASERRPTEAEGRLYGQLISSHVAGSPFKPPSRSDFTPRLRVSHAMA